MVLLHYPTSGGGPAGLERYALGLADALAAAGEPVRRWAMPPRELRLGRLRVGGLVGRQLQLRLGGPRAAGDVLHSAHAYAASARADVVTLHDCFPETLRAELGRTDLEHRLWLRSLDGLRRRGTHVLTPTQHVRGVFLGLHPGFPADRVHVTPLGLGPEFRPPAPDAPRHPAFRDGVLNVLGVSDLNPRKRLDWLLDAARATPGVRVVHAGVQVAHRAAWAEQAAREATAAHGLGDRFVRLGKVPAADLVRLYQGADLVVHPTLDEGFGWPPLEALACGTPVLVPDIPVLRETLGDQATFFQGPAGLADALRALSAAGARRLPLETAARVRSTHAWDATARATMRVYDVVRASRR